MAKQYDPKQVSLSIGTHTVQGYADGTFANWESNREDEALTVGADGEGATARSNDESGRLTITILQTSISNDILTGFRNGRTRFPVLMKDSNGTTVLAAAIAYIVTRPGVEFSNEITNREWIIESASWDYQMGGIPA